MDICSVQDQIDLLEWTKKRHSIAKLEVERLERIMNHVTMVISHDMEEEFQRITK